ncbi:MAG: inositol 2-dehydrogenase, partial [Hyphomicrobiales bacterium]|nr:inositol 2-dehydrogenase [Hyphomicrobiales bacterium]
MLRFGILGAGRIGKLHGGNIAGAPNARLVAVADVIDQAARDLAAATGSEVRSIDDVIAAGDIDAILIGSSTDTHADLIEQSVQAGKAVLCEKPVDLSAKRIEQCLEVVEKAGKPLMIGFNRRFDPNFAELKRRLDDGAIGPVEMVTIISRDPEPPPVSYVERSGGLYRDMMIHDFDLARFLLGEEPVEVHAIGSVLVDEAIGKAGDVDTAMVMLRTESGKLCQISCSRRASYGYDQRIEVHGSGGMLRAGNLHETTVEVATGDGFALDPVLNFFLERYELAYRLELAAFIDAVESGTPPS